MFGATGCFQCHRFAGEGGAVGPDLTQVAGRFSARDLLESIIEPGCRISETALIRSLIGRNCVVEGQPDKEEAARLNIGDNSIVISGQ